MRIRPLVGLVTTAALLAAPAAYPAGSVPLPKPRPMQTSAKDTTPARSPATASFMTPAARFTLAASDFTPATDIAVLREAVTAARRGKTAQAADLQKTIGDPIARKLVEWTILRSDETQSIDVSRYMAFITDNPSWPSIALLRRRAEATLWADRLDPAFVRAFFGKEAPTTTKGKFALARALLLQGDRAGAQRLVLEAWRYDSFSSDLDNPVLDVFNDLITPADHKARMDMRLYAEDIDGGLRAANRAGGNAPVIAKARIAVISKSANANTLLDAAPPEAHRDAGYVFSRVQFLRRANEAGEAAAWILSLPAHHGQTIDTDQWWIQRRLVARKLLDIGDAKTAYRVARDAAIPSKDNYRAEHQFTAGWIALRFLNDPATALAHFAKVAQGNSNPISLARAGYWPRRARITRRPRAIPPPTTGSSRAPGSVTKTSSSAPRPSRPRIGAMRSRGSRSRAQSSFSTPSTSGIWSRARWPISANARSTPLRSPQSATSPPATRMRAPWCCSARQRSDAGFRSITMPFRTSAFPNIAPSARRSSAPWSSPSLARRAPSTRRPFPARVPWA